MKGNVRKMLIVLTSIVCAICVFRVGYGMFSVYSAKKDYAQLSQSVNLPAYTEQAAENEENVPAYVKYAQDYEELFASDTSGESFEDAVTFLPDSTPVIIEDEAEVEKDAYAEQLTATDLDAVKMQNEDIIAWIVIPGTELSYPVAQGEDNSYYLTHSFKKWWSHVGTIFADYRSSAALTDFHTILYGHNLQGGGMFSSLVNYKDEAYFAAHPSIYFVTEDRVLRYDVFAAYEADAQNGHSYRLGLTREKDKNAFIEYCVGNSAIETGIFPSAEDTILTLSTCTQTGYYDYATRWVVHAVLRYEQPITE